MPLPTQRAVIPLSAGLQNKTDPRALEPPYLELCENVSFDDLGGLRKRRDFTDFSTSASEDGATTLPQIRRFAVHNGTLLAFTETAIYAWLEGENRWAYRAEHLATDVAEATVFASTDEQANCERAELGGIVFYAWEGTSAVHIAAVDKASGGVIAGPVAQDASTQLPRMIACPDAASPVVLIVCQTAASTLKVKALDPDDLATTLASAWTSATTITSSMSESFDVAEYGGTGGVCVYNVGASYGIVLIAADASLTYNRSKAYTSNDGISCAVSPDQTEVAVLRYVTTTAKVDFLDGADLTDSTMDTTVASGTEITGVTRMACVYNDTKDGSSRWVLHCIWVLAEAVSGVNTTEVNTVTVTEAGGAGTVALMTARLTIGAKPFSHGGRVYCWMAFIGESTSVASALETQVQNSYFLLDTSGRMEAKAVTYDAGGAPDGTGSYWYPSVQNTATNQYAFCATERRLLELGQDSRDYAARTPREVILDFDSNEARRTAQVGGTLYITGSQVMQFDGTYLTELGFPIYPWYFNVATDGAGQLNGTYRYKVTWRWENAQGEIERSTTASVEEIASLSSNQTTISIAQLYTTRKFSAFPNANANAASPPPVVVEVWRSLQDPTTSSPYYLVTDTDPTNTAGDNHYLTNDPTDSALITGWDDDMVDATADDKQLFYENGGILENLAPPSATIIATGQDRVFLAGVPDRPHTVYYSKQRADGELAAFNDALAVSIPSAAGAVTALAILNETLVVFTRTATYTLPGTGVTNAGGGSNYGPPRVISEDCGAVSQDALAVTPLGVVFLSPKGWYLLDRGFTPRYIGGPVRDYDDATYTAVHVMRDEHQIRCFADGAHCLVYDYVANQWSVWNLTGTHAALWASTLGGTPRYVYARTKLTAGDTPTAEDAIGTNDGAHSYDIKSAPIRLAGIQGYKRARKVQILGEYRSPFVATVDFYKDDETTPFQTKTWARSDLTAGDPLRVQFRLAVQRMSSLQVRIRDTTANGESFRLTSIVVLYGEKRGLDRLPASERM